jgi:hypothetical protein
MGVRRTAWSYETQQARKRGEYTIYDWECWKSCSPVTILCCRGTKAWDDGDSEVGPTRLRLDLGVFLSQRRNTSSRPTQHRPIPHAPPRPRYPQVTGIAVRAFYCTRTTVRL